MTSPAIEKGNERRYGPAAIAAVIVCITVYTAMQGLTYPLLALILEQQGVDKVLIGLSAAMTPLGLLISAPIVPRIVDKAGAWNALVASLVIAILCLIGTGLIRDQWVWLPLRFMIGFMVNMIFIIGETWINQMARPETRGRTLSLYITFCAGGFAAGPLILSFTGAQGWAPFIAGASIGITALIMVIPQRGRFPEIRYSKAGTIRAFLPHAPVLLLAVGAFAFFDQTVLTLLPLYALSHGYDTAGSTVLLATLISGNIVLQTPLGWLADRMEKRLLLIACAIAAAIGAPLLGPAIEAGWTVYPMVFVWGGMTAGLYTLALVELGERFTGDLLVAGNAAFAAVWGIGGIFGPPVSGGLMEAFGPPGLPVSVFFVFAFLALLAWKRRRKPEKKQTAG